MLFDTNLMDAAEAEREDQRVVSVLSACLERIRDRTRDIEVILDEKHKAESLLCRFVASELEDAVRDVMRVPEYSQKAQSKQRVFLFIGTHWEEMVTQIFYDFVREASIRMGLPLTYNGDPAFMNKVFEYLAFRLSKYTVTAQPHNGVWINLRNCTVEITSDTSATITTHAHRPEDFFLYCLPYSYDPDAQCPLWHAFLDEVLPDKSTQSLLGEYIGYCFTRNLHLEKMLVLYGSGANGKSVIMNIIKNLMGGSNVSEGTLSSITTDPEARSLLENKLVNISSESGRKLDTAVLKMLISGEPVEMRKLYVGTRMLYNPPKLITSYNELPPMENTYGYRRRWLLLPFNKTIQEHQQDPALAHKLCCELPGIMNWILGLLAQLLARVQANSGEDFTYSEECQHAMAEYARLSNSAMLFLHECCTIKDGEFMSMKNLYNQYQLFCRATGTINPFILKNFKKFVVEWGATPATVSHVIYFNVTCDTSNYV